MDVSPSPRTLTPIRKREHSVYFLHKPYSTALVSLQLFGELYRGKTSAAFTDSNAPIRAFACRVASYFVPAAISPAGITFFGWIFLSNVLTEAQLPDMFHNHDRVAAYLQLCISVVVVVECPCAFGLSTLTAIMVGTGGWSEERNPDQGGRTLEASPTLKRVLTGDTAGTEALCCGRCLSADERARQNAEL
ncbi:hypothetical protein EI94DRAFT_1797519 [Lactarius quietus]|nr:hypothetical protein EI94DRAFT_1797519 [Lactarius quietus]